MAPPAAAVLACAPLAVPRQRPVARTERIATLARRAYLDRALLAARAMSRGQSADVAGMAIRLGGRFNTRVGGGYVGILSVELHFPEAGSLKGKRKYVKSAKAQLQQRFGAAVAEVDHHELWQRAGLTVACVARGHRELEELLAGAERYLGGQEYELVQIERQVLAAGEG